MGKDYYFGGLTKEKIIEQLKIEFENINLEVDDIILFKIKNDCFLKNKLNGLNIKTWKVGKSLEDKKYSCYEPFRSYFTKLIDGLQYNYFNFISTFIYYRFGRISYLKSWSYLNMEYSLFRIRKLIQVYDDDGKSMIFGIEIFKENSLKNYFKDIKVLNNRTLLITFEPFQKYILVAIIKFKKRYFTIKYSIKKAIEKNNNQFLQEILRNLLWFKMINHLSYLADKKNFYFKSKKYLKNLLVNIDKFYGKYMIQDTREFLRFIVNNEEVLEKILENLLSLKDLILYGKWRNKIVKILGSSIREWENYYSMVIDLCLVGDYLSLDIKNLNITYNNIKYSDYCIIYINGKRLAMELTDIYEEDEDINYAIKRSYLDTIGELKSYKYLKYIGDEYYYV